MRWHHSSFAPRCSVSVVDLFKVSMRRAHFQVSFGRADAAFDSCEGYLRAERFRELERWTPVTPADACGVAVVDTREEG